MKQKNLVKNKIDELIEQGETDFRSLKTEDKSGLISLLFMDENYEPFDELFDLESGGINIRMFELINNKISPETFKHIIINNLYKIYCIELETIFKNELDRYESSFFKINQNDEYDPEINLTASYYGG